MPLLTSRMEKELIFSSFAITKPELCIRGTGLNSRVPYDEYLSEMNCITLLNAEQFFAGNTVIVSFLYKKTKIFFRTVIEKENAVFFRIPQDIHVARKKRKKAKFPSMRLYYQNFLLSTFAPSQSATKKTTEPIETQGVQDIFAYSRSMGHDLVYLLKEMKQCLPVGCSLYSHLHIVGSFLKEKKRATKDKQNVYIFSDSHVVLLFSTSNFALQFSNDKLKTFKASIAFKDRQIDCEVQYSFFSPFTNKDSKRQSIRNKQKTATSVGFLCFKIVDIHEEDRRYLYESVFSHLYGNAFYADKNL